MRHKFDTAQILCQTIKRLFWHESDKCVVLCLKPAASERHKNDMALFVGREIERAEFQQLFRKKTASLAICEGRRRIGKSTFVRECARDADHFLSFEGLPPRPNIGRKEQLDIFAQRLADQTKAPKVALESWPQAFQLLASLLPATGWTVLLLDEISWMAMALAAR